MTPTKLANANSSVVTVTNTATGLYDLIFTAGAAATNFRGSENAVVLVVEDGDVRMLADGNTPTSTKGLLLSEGGTYFFTGIDPGKIKLIRTGGSNVSVDVEVGMSAPGESSNSMIGGSGTISGTGAANQVAYWTNATTISGDTNFRFNGSSVYIGDLGDPGTQDLFVGSRVTNNTEHQAIRGRLDVAMTGVGSTSSFYGLFFPLTNQGATEAIGGEFFGSYSLVVNTENETISTASGVMGAASLNAGTTTVATGLRARINMGGGTVGTAAGLWVTAISNAGGTITDAYGVKIDAPGMGGNQYSLGVTGGFTTLKDSVHIGSNAFDQSFTLKVTGAIATSSVGKTAVNVVAGAHTGLAANDFNDVIFDLNRTVNFEGGEASFDINNFLITAPTYEADMAQNIGKAATVKITGAPVASANITITTPLSLLVETGDVAIGEALAIGKTTAPSVTLDVAGFAVVESTDTATAAGTSNLVNTQFHVFPSGNTAREYRGYAVSVFTSGAAGNITSPVSAFRGMTRIEANRTFTQANGAVFVMDIDVGTVTEANGLRVAQEFSGGTIATSRGIYVPAIVGATAPTTAYGIQVDSPGVGATQWTAAIGAGNSYIAGSLALGSTTTPTDKLHITGGGISWATGTAVTAGNYQIIRDADGTNQLHLNVPTGAGMELSINDVAQMQMSSAGDFGIGAAPSALTKLYLTKNISDGGGWGINAQMYAVPVAATANSFTGIAGFISTENSFDAITGSVAGFAGQSQIYGAFPVATAYGATGIVGLNTTDTATTIAGVAGWIDMQAGTATTAIALWAKPVTSLVGTITTAYGLKVDPPGMGATQYTLGIGTGNSHVLGQLSVGTINSSTIAQLNVLGTATNTTSTFSGARNQVTANPTGASSATYYGTFGTAINNAAAFDITGALVGNYGLALGQVAARDVTTLTGNRGDAQITNGTATNMYGAQGLIRISGGTATTAAALYAAPVISTGGTITTTYGLLVSPPGAGLTQWTVGIGSGNSYIEGSIRIGSTVAPTVALDVTGAIRSNTSLILEDPGVGTNTVTIQAPTLAGSYVLTLPTTDGDANQVLTTDGAGVLSWTTSVVGDITAVGDVASGAAFNGTQGTTLTFFNGGGNMTVAYDGTTLATSKTIKPSANDGAALGLSGTAFSDLFLASGGVINFNAGNVTITQSAATLTFNSTSLVGIGSNITGTQNVALTLSIPAQTTTSLSGVGITIQSDTAGVGGGGNPAGTGGALLLKGGTGGAAGAAGEFSGAGGGVTLQGGTSGAASVNEVADAGGTTTVIGGTGGAGSAAQLSGNGGDVTIKAGAPGATGGAGTGTYGTTSLLSGDGSVEFTVAGLTNRWTHFIKDNDLTPYRLAQSSNNYIAISTVNGSEEMNFGNATTNPTYAFLGSGSFSFPSGSAILSGRLLEDMGASVAAANDLTLGTGGNCFEITGNTQINAIATNLWQAGSLITLGFAGTPTVKHNTAGGAGFQKIFLAGGVDFVASANDTLTLRYMVIGAVNGWYEVSRTAI